MKKVMRATVLAMAGCCSVGPAWSQQSDHDELSGEAGGAYSAIVIAGNSPYSGRNIHGAFMPGWGLSDFGWRSNFPRSELRDLITDTMALGYIWGNIKIEGSLSRAIKHNRGHLDFGHARPFGIESGKLAYSPASGLTLQISREQLNRPEQGDPEDGERRTMISAIYARSVDAVHWQTTLAVGRGAKKANGFADNAYLLESKLRIAQAHTLFGRLERATGDEIFNERDNLHGQEFTASKATLGYVYSVVTDGPARISIGAVAGKRFASESQVALVSRQPVSCKLFFRLSLHYR